MRKIDNSIFKNFMITLHTGCTVVYGFRVESCRTCTVPRTGWWWSPTVKGWRNTRRCTTRVSSSHTSKFFQQKFMYRELFLGRSFVLRLAPVLFLEINIERLYAHDTNKNLVFNTCFILHRAVFVFKYSSSRNNLKFQLILLNFLILF